MKKNILKILFPLFALLLCGILVIVERKGVVYHQKNFIDQDRVWNSNVTKSSEVQDTTNCLILKCDKDDLSDIDTTMMKFVLDNMKIKYDVKDAADLSGATDFEQYQNIIITFEDWSNLGNHVIELCNWVKTGGYLMNTCAPIPNSEFKSISTKLGIQAGGETYAGIKGIRFRHNCMIGAKDNTIFQYDDAGEGLQISLAAELDENCTKYMESSDGKVPILWKKPYGAGAFVILNETLNEKYQRGILCLAYSLLGDYCIYPVINGSAYYLDDFPSPVPQGNSQYIKRDYGVDTATFYSNIWWSTMLTWEKKYGIKHTGVIIEEYSNQIKAPFKQNEATTQFTMFGNMLLNNGGELGFHGYNHIPLCLKGVDDNQKYGDYKLWKSKLDMDNSLSELNRFSSKLFPSVTFRVYVPPSNIISQTGIEELEHSCPDIKVIASTYLVDANNKAYVQEFSVDKNGIVQTPRIVSGCNIDQYEILTELSELNFQFVQSHFMHPDDCLDVERGANLGWKKLSAKMESYLKWIHTSAKGLKEDTGSELGGAVVTYSGLSVQRNYENQTLTVNVGGFSKEAYFLLRINKGSIKKVENCSYQKETGSLYLIHATKKQIKIFLGDE